MRLKTIKILEINFSIISLFFVNFLILLCIYYYYYHVPVTALHAEIALMHEKNQALEATIMEVLKKLEVVEPRKKVSIFYSLVGYGGSSSISPYVKYLCGCACAVVVVVVCAKVWPVQFIAIQNYTYPYILSCFGYSRTETLLFRTVSPEGTSYDWLITSSLDYVNIAIKFTGAPDAEYMPLHLFLDMAQKCAGEATDYPYYFLYNHMLHLAKIADATATASQVLPIF